MSDPVAGYPSRICFCLWSSGNYVHEAIQDNHKTYLHSFWEREYFFVEGADGVSRFSICRALWSAATYPVGMVGYLIDTVMKVILVLGNFFVLLISLIRCDPLWGKRRGIILVDSLAALGISIIGIAAPPLAYRLDQITQDAMLNWNSP